MSLYLVLAVLAFILLVLPFLVFNCFPDKLRDLVFRQHVRWLKKQKQVLSIVILSDGRMRLLILMTLLAVLISLSPVISTWSLSPE